MAARGLSVETGCAAATVVPMERKSAAVAAVVIKRMSDSNASEVAPPNSQPKGAINDETLRPKSEGFVKVELRGLEPLTPTLPV
ncbi:hypothetical protein GCM10011591_15460 [Nocardia camponoti]|uniref:Uncharacterized protein n=1 Tax=Nocardia camponoti TaxID=1616106 RepID=A0A917V618_9NOCA|nr:hypothetical protein GCM10011591_15460 [Nocardia camponoti]